MDDAAMSATMPYRRLGRSGLTVSRLVLGAMMFGSRTEEDEARRIIDAVAEAGVNFIDTADNYAEGRSEEIVGRAIAADRHRWVLATKLANPSGNGPNRRGLSRKWIIEEAHASLKRLGTEFIDILYFHKEDPLTPLEESVRAIADLQRQGAVRYFGISNFKAWRIAWLCAACDEAGIDRPVVCQPLYHALNRSVEVEVLPACAALGVGVISYSPIARGLLTGKYVPDQPPPADSRAGVNDQRIMETEFRPETMRAAQVIVRHAAERGIDPVVFATAWVLANPIVTGTIAGPRTLAQWQNYLPALAETLSEEDERAVDRVVKPGATAAHQYIDPAYPVEGRPRRP
jgi:aryl-alcohol dehydrogenase-like predicted oxidoreductase